MASGAPGPLGPSTTSLRAPPRHQLSSFGYFTFYLVLVRDSGLSRAYAPGHACSIPGARRPHGRRNDRRRCRRPLFVPGLGRAGDRRDQPGVRRRWQHRCPVHQRLRGAVQPRRLRRHPRGMVPAVRQRHRHRDLRRQQARPVRHPRARALPPGPARRGRDSQCPAAVPRHHRRPRAERHGGQGRAGPLRRGPRLQRRLGALHGRPARPAGRPGGIRHRQLLRGSGGPGADQLHRGDPRRARLRRHRRQRRRLSPPAPRRRATRRPPPPPAARRRATPRRRRR